MQKAMLLLLLLLLLQLLLLMETRLLQLPVSDRRSTQAAERDGHVEYAVVVTTVDTATYRAAEMHATVVSANRLSTYVHAVWHLRSIVG